MKQLILLCGVLVSSVAFEQCNFAKHFVISYNSGQIFSSLHTENSSLQMEADTLKETDLIRIQFKECDPSPAADYELHIKVTNSTIDHTFINDSPDFTLNMGWLTQYRNKEVSFYFHFFHPKYTKNASSPYILKVADIYIS